MTPTLRRRSLPGSEAINLVLFTVMAASLAVVILAGAVFLIWNGQAIGNAASWVADVCAWVFTVAFVAAFVVAMIEQRRTELANPGLIRRGGGVSTHH